MEISHLSWPWHRSDATALAGYVKMMIMMMMSILYFRVHQITIVLYFEQLLFETQRNECNAINASHLMYKIDIIQ